MSQFSNSSALIANRFKITDTTFPLQAKGILTLTGQPLDTETVTIDTKVYTFQTVLTDVDGNVLIGATASDSLDNLIAAITLGAGSGTLYAALTTLHPTVSAAAGAGDTMDAASRLAGDQANLIATTEMLTNGSWGDATLAGGVSATTWMDFNSVDRLPARLAFQVKEIYTLDNFGPPVNGQLVLESGFLYIIKSTIVTPFGFLVPESGVIAMEAENNDVNVVVLVGAGPMWSSNGLKTNVMLMRDITFVQGGPPAKLFDVSGERGASSRFFWDRVSFISFSDLGDVKEFDFNIFDFALFNGISGALTFTDCGTIDIRFANIIGSGSGTTAHMRFLGNRTNQILISDDILVPIGAESSWFISPTISPTAFVFIRFCVPSSPTGSAFFEPGATGIITNIVNDSKTAEPIPFVNSGTVIPAGGNYARFTLAGADVFIGEIDTLSTFATAGYNKTGIVVFKSGNLVEYNDVATGLPIVFVIDEPGQYDTDRADVTSSVAHGRSDGDSLLQKNTINFNGGFSIYDTQTTTTVYKINLTASFPGVETAGNWDTGSLTQKEPRVTAKDNGTQPDSMNLGFAEMNGNITPTLIAFADTYQPIEFNGAVQNSASELWTLIDSTKLIFRYDGLNSVVPDISLDAWALKAGSTENYRITITKNGVIPVFATEFFSPLEVKTVKTQVSAMKIFTVNPGDTIQPLVASETTTDSITFTDANFLPKV